MGALQAGDQVFDEAGRPCTVTFATDVMHGRDCYDVVFDDGTVITADAEHLWLTKTHATRKAEARRAESPGREWPERRHFPTVITTEQILATLHHGPRADRNHSIDVAGALQLPEAELPIDPYVLGVWLGDGDSAGATLSALNRAGLLKNKHIPPAYLRASATQRMALLQGLMDTDGTVQVGGYCEFLVTNRALAEGAREIITSLGLKSTFAEGRAMLDGRDCGPKYRIKFTPHVPVFRLQRKLDRQHGGKSQALRGKRRYIVDVRPRTSVPVRCIQVDSPSHLFLASRSMIPTHNTRTGAQWVIEQVNAGAKRIHIVGRTSADVRDTMVQGESGILGCSPPWDRPVYQPSKRRLLWANGAQALCFSADKPDQLRGPQCEYAWADELAAWRFPDAWDQLMMGLRLGARPRVVVTTTPRATKIVRELAYGPMTAVTRGRTFDNRANLASTFLSQVVAKYEGTRLGRQELDGELLEDVAGALWKRGPMLDSLRVHAHPPLKRIVVAIDPAVADVSLARNNATAETGIVVAGLGIDGHGYVLDDLSGHYSPNEWAAKAIGAYKLQHADRIVAEVNNGGALVESNLRAVDKTISYRAVYASRGKRTRAEPISAMYERGMIHHVGVLPELEDQLCSWDATLNERSPDRLDALVWALTDLMVESGTAPSFKSTAGFVAPRTRF